MKKIGRLLATGLLLVSMFAFTGCGAFFDSIEDLFGGIFGNGRVIVEDVWEEQTDFERAFSQPIYSYSARSMPTPILQMPDQEDAGEIVCFVMEDIYRIEWVHNDIYTFYGERDKSNPMLYVRGYLPEEGIDDVIANSGEFALIFDFSNADQFDESDFERDGNRYTLRLYELSARKQQIYLFKDYFLMNEQQVTWTFVIEDGMFVRFIIEWLEPFDENPTIEFDIFDINCTYVSEPDWVTEYKLKEYSIA